MTTLCNFTYDEITLGQTATYCKTLSERDILLFAEVSGDVNPVHIDPEFAARSMFGERIAHGMLGLSIATGLAIRLGFLEETVIAFMGLEWKFRGPIKIGDTIKVRAEVAETKLASRLGGGLVTFNVEVVNQRNETCQKGTWTMLVKARGA